MQDPNADTEWNDALRKFDIIPQKAKEEVTLTEEQVVSLVDAAAVKQLNAGVKGLEDLTLDELDELEDEEDERVLLEYRKKRMAEMMKASVKARYGEVLEITAEEYIQQVNKAGSGVWVVLHLYQNGVPLCTLINQYLMVLAVRFPDVKFIRSVSTLCIPNYPDSNLPTIFIYYEGDLKKQFVGPPDFGGLSLKQDDLEWMLSEVGVLKTDLEEDPRRKTKISSIRKSEKTRDDSDNDW